MSMIVDEVSRIGRNGKTFERQKLEAEKRDLYRYKVKADGIRIADLRQQESGR